MIEMKVVFGLEHLLDWGTNKTLFEAFFCYYSQSASRSPLQLACGKKRDTTHTQRLGILCSELSVCWVSMISVRSQIHNLVCSLLTLQPGNRLTPRVRSSPMHPCGTRFSNHSL